MRWHDGRRETSSGGAPRDHYDVIVVGAGIGGIYAVHRFMRDKLTVLGLEGAKGVGGVWYHNRYPGARVDVDSMDYCYHFSPEIAQNWRWLERYAAQPEILEYLNFVADALDVRRHFLFDTWLTSARWNSEAATYRVTTSTDASVSCRYLVMTTGNLSVPQTPAFPGLARFKGDWVRTSEWPEAGVPLGGQRIGIIGTGSSGIQAIPILAKHSDHLTVFQRTPHYSVPACNAPMALDAQERMASRVLQERKALLATPVGTRDPIGAARAGELSEKRRQGLLERQWCFGGQGMTAVFADQGTNRASNAIVSEFLRDKISQLVADPAVAQRLSPTYPIGSRRLALDIGYYDTYNRDDVRLVDLREDPIVEMTETGIRTKTGQHRLDLIIFALGFQAFTGALDNARIRNEDGRGPTDRWNRGPRTMLGLMTTGFPNLFLPTGPGSPSVLSNLTLSNEFSIDWIADAIVYLQSRGLRSIAPSEEAEDAWTRHVIEVAFPLIRLREENYMVHVNADGSRAFIPYVAGLDRYVERATHVAEHDYAGFILR